MNRRKRALEDYRTKRSNQRKRGKKVKKHKQGGPREETGSLGEGERGVGVMAKVTNQTRVNGKGMEYRK